MAATRPSANPQSNPQNHPHRGGSKWGYCWGFLDAEKPNTHARFSVSWDFLVSPSCPPSINNIHPHKNHETAAHTCSVARWWFTERHWGIEVEPRVQPRDGTDRRIAFKVWD